MSKKQLIAVMILPAVAAVLLIWQLASGLSSPAENTSAVIYIAGFLAGLFSLCTVGGLFLTIVNYPAEGYASLAPPPVEPSSDDEGAVGGDLDDDMVDGEFGDDEFDDGGFGDEEYDDEFDDAGDEFDESDEFEDDDELW